MSRLEGCKRGIYGLGTWDPPRRPHPETLEKILANNRASSTDTSRAITKAAPAEEENKPASLTVSASAKREPMMAKYNYSANKDTPLGQELTVVQGDNLNFIQVHDENDNWWLAENSEGALGYVPASYMMKLETKTSSLPWLQNRQVEVEEDKTATNVFGVPEQAVYKPYVSSYDHKGLPEKKDKAKEWYCDICSKQLNGPKPYSAHMMSKAHKEEVELRAEYDREEQS